MLQRIVKKQGIDFKMNTKVTSVERLGSGEIQVAMETVKGGKAETHMRHSTSQHWKKTLH